jgi:RNA polymerase sigma factor (sigma-70 family)
MAKNISVGKSVIITKNDTLLKYIQEIKNYPKLTQEEEIKLFKENKESSKNKIIKSNLRFVTQVANKYVGMGVDIEDLIAFGRVGLIEAYDKFDINKGVRFITFAVWYIRAEIQKSLNDLSRTVRVPSHYKEKKSYSTNIDDLKIDFETPNTNSELDDRDFLTTINRVLSHLKPKEREAIKRFYGIEFIPQKMEYIAKEMNVSAERVRQLIRRGEESLKKLENIEIIKKLIE